MDDNDILGYALSVSRRSANALAHAVATRLGHQDEKVGGQNASDGRLQFSGTHLMVQSETAQASQQLRQ